MVDPKHTVVVATPHEQYANTIRPRPKILCSQQGRCRRRFLEDSSQRINLPRPINALAYARASDRCSCTCSTVYRLTAAAQWQWPLRSELLLQYICTLVVARNDAKLSSDHFHPLKLCCYR